MRHRSLGTGFTPSSCPYTSSSNHNFSQRPDFQLRRSHASIEAHRVVLETSSGMETKNTDSHGANARKIHMILIVEDDKNTSRLNRSILEDEGYSVACAGSGEEALNMLAATSPSLVLLDVMLPIMDGFTTFEKIRDNSRVPIIFVSTEDRDEDMVRGLELGADDYIAKPFSTCELSARVKAVLRRNNSKRQKMAVQPKLIPPDMSFLDKPEEPVGDATKPISNPKNSPLKSFGNGLTASSTVGEPSADLNGADDNYEGAVKLVVETAGEIKNLVKFIGSLRENPQFHLLRVVSNASRDGMDVWLRLRTPNPLRTTLIATCGVSRVEAMEDSEIDSESGAEMSVLKVSLD